MLAADLATAQTSSGPYSFFGVTPCRVVDTRGPVGPTGGPILQSSTPRNVPIIGASGCNIPSTAKGVTLNLTLITPSVNGYITIWPAGGTTPLASNINASANTPAIANAAVVLMTNQPDGTNISVVFGTGQPGTAHLAIDVTGYFQ